VSVRPATHVGWARASFDALRPHLENAVYVDNLGTEVPERVRCAYCPNHARLAALHEVVRGPLPVRPTKNRGR
jgi:hypothetical protein